MSDIELNAEAFIQKHKKKQEEKRRLEVKLEMEKESLKKVKEEIEKLGYKDYKELKLALDAKEKEILAEIKED
jgi:ACT domain-containing protein